MKCEIQDYEMLELLKNRLKVWTDNEDTIDLYMKMYENYVDCGLFEDNNKTIMEIVDNDYVNWCKVITKEECTEVEWKMYVDFIKENGTGDISCESSDLYKKDIANHKIGFVEAYDSQEEPQEILIRYC